VITARINDIGVEVPEGTSILDAARHVQVKIPTLCKHRDLVPTAACGICIVRNRGGNKLIRACCTPLEQGMELATHDREIVDVRRSTLELILSNHPQACLTCGRNGECELQSLAADFNIPVETIKRYGYKFETFKSDLDGKRWLDVPFAYEPFWEKKSSRSHATMKTADSFKYEDPEIEQMFKRSGSKGTLGEHDKTVIAVLGDPMYTKRFKLPKWNRKATVLDTHDVAVRHWNELGIPRSKSARPMASICNRSRWTPPVGWHLESDTSIIPVLHFSAAGVV